MPGLILPQRYVQQPQQAVPLDTGNPRAGGLASYLPLAGLGVDAVDNRAWTAVVGTTPLAFDSAARGRALSVKGASAAYLSRLLPTAISASATQPFTLRFRLLLRSVSSTHAIMSWGTVAQDGAPRFYVKLNAGGTLSFYVGAAYRAYVPAVAASTEYIIEHTYDGLTQCTYINGVLIGSAVVTLAGNAASLYLGMGFDGLTASADFLISDFAMWGRGLSTQEAANDAQNPRDMLKAPPRRLWLATVGGVGTTTLTPATANLTLIGFAPTVQQSANQSVSPAPAALTLTGFAPTVTRTANQSVSPAPAALTLTGYAPTVAQSANVTLSPATASLTLVGFAPTVTQSGTTSLSPAPALLSLTGFAPSVTQTSTRTLTPAPAILTFTGYAPSVTQGPAQLAGPTPAYGVSTVMRASTTNRTASLRDSYAIQGGTLHDSYSISTILRATTTNRTAALDDAPLNLTASLQ